MPDDVNVIVVWTGANELIRESSPGAWDSIAYPLSSQLKREVANLAAALTAVDRALVILGASSRAFGVDPNYDRAIDELCEIFYEHNILVTNGAFLFDRLAADPRHKGLV